MGEVSVQLGQQSAEIELRRNSDLSTLVPIAATPSNLQQIVFTFSEGGAFGLAEVPIALAIGTFEGNTGDFTLAMGGFVASGQVTISSCDFLVTASTFPPGPGPQIGDRITIDPCEVDAIDGRLLVTNEVTDVSSTSELPVLAAPGGALLLPAAPPMLVTDEDTPAITFVNAILTGERPGGLTFAITGMPAHGTAAVDTTGLLFYQPAADFQGSDRLVVTVTATFTDGSSPPILLGTVPVLITVQSVNDFPQGIITVPASGMTMFIGQTITFEGTCTDPDSNTPLTFLWDFGGGAPNVTVQNPGPVTFATTGTFTVTFTCTDALGAADPTPSTRTVIVLNNQPPDATIAAPATDVTIAVGQTVDFQGSCTDPDSNTPLTFLWDFGGGAPNVTVQNPGAVTFATAGIFPVTFTCTDALGMADSSPATRTVTVNLNRPPAPTAPPITTPADTPGTSQIAANDPDAGQTHTFAVTTAPSHGTATVAPTGLVTYTPNAGFTGTDSVTVTVTDNGTPSLSAPVTISITVTGTGPSPTFIVNTTADNAGDANPGDGICETALGNGVCTLRAAIQEANSLAGPDQIAFNIPGAGPLTIQPIVALPTITDPVTIDGTTQPGFAGMPVIELDGSVAPGDGLKITTGDSLVRGLVIHSFSDSGIFISGSGGNVIVGNFIGTDVTGTVALGNSNGVDIFAAPGNVIGGSTPDRRNLISGNTFAGITITEMDATGNLVQGNFIGTDVTGTVALGNFGAGVLIDFGSSNNSIGGLNTIAFNGFAGVAVLSGTSNAIRANAIFANAGLGIDLGSSGVTSNDDVGDFDTGPNNLQNFPVLTLVSSNIDPTIDGTLESAANTTFSLEFFANVSCDSSGNGEGETLLGSTTRSTDSIGRVNFTVNFPGITVPSGHVITATATDPSNNTSEFSLCFTVP